MLWYWETQNERSELDLLRSTISQLDLGVVPESEDNKPTKWKIKCGFMFRKKPKDTGPSGSGAPQQKGQANRLFKVEDLIKHKNQVVLVLPAPKPGAAPKATALTDGNRTARHTLLQASSNVMLFPFYSDFTMRKEVVIEGDEFVVGDFAISLGVSRVSPRVYIVIKVRHIPCQLKPTATAWKNVCQCLGIGTRFPEQAVPVSFEQFAPTLDDSYGPLHQAVEIVELCSWILNLQ
mmetsp:Transcript_16989/g.27501  ORF Transcript_16989/g.27501 Transcript_16989/m.27501 type:complete len:235 (+) Transcript_16989:202-906(+)